MKYLIIQSLAGILLLVIFIVRNFPGISTFWILLLNVLIIFKLGAAPFYRWVLAVGEKQSWWGLFFILTVQKIIPLHIITLFLFRPMIRVSVISWLILPVIILRLKRIKKIIIISSTFIIIGLLSALLLAGHKWKTLLITYCVSLRPLLGLRGTSRGGTLRPKGLEYYRTQILWLTLILTILGMPPLPGFLIKFDISTSMLFSGFISMALIFNIISSFLIYIYVNIILSKILTSGTYFSHQLSNSSRFKLLRIVIIISWVLL